MIIHRPWKFRSRLLRRIKLWGDKLFHQPATLYLKECCPELVIVAPQQSRVQSSVQSYKIIIACSLTEEKSWNEFQQDEHELNKKQNMAKTVKYMKIYREFKRFEIPVIRRFQPKFKDFWSCWHNSESCHTCWSP